MSWSLELFERQSYGGDLEGAARSLLDLLNRLNNNYGDIGQEFNLHPSSEISLSALQDHAIVRLCSAITCLFANQQFAFTPVALAQVLNWHRWISTIFSASNFINADHLLRSMNVSDHDGSVEISESKLQQFIMLFSPDSGVPINIERLYENNSLTAVGLGLALLSPRFLGTVAAHNKREILLPWLTDKLAYIDSIDQLPTTILHDVYMHCSYANSSNRHDIKRSINRLVRKSLYDAGFNFSKIDRPLTKGKKKKPLMLVVLEWFSKGHSIYRTHSKTIAGAREIFEVVAIAYPNMIDDVGSGVFDEVVSLNSDLPLIEQIRFIDNIARENNAQVLYMPSVGMFPLTLFLSNARICPLQLMALGHPATSHSEEMDYVVVEEDYVGDPSCFSEKLLLLPSDGMPYRPSELLDQIKPLFLEKGRDAIVDIVVCATTMKLNPEFLGVCAKIAERANTPVKFHFLVGQAVGFVYPAVQRFVKQFLGEAAIVYPHQPYPNYIEVIARADLFLNPFPFGNTNGIIDTISAGLVGVCKTGREVFEHIDQGLFERLAMPSWLIAKTNDEYVSSALRLIENPDERMHLRKTLSGDNRVKVLFEGRPKIMGQLIYEKRIELK